MRARTRFQRLLLLSSCLAGAAWAARAGEAAAVLLPEHAPEPVRWAASELAAALRLRQPPGGVSAGAIRVNQEEPGPDTTKTPEAFTLRAEANEPVTVTASDANGAMYGLLELAEQLGTLPAGSSWAELRAHVSPVSARPAVRLRAVNLFLHVMPDGRVADWFHDEEFWRRLLELLARSRFNLIDLHGAYCPRTTVFSNLLPLFTGGGPGSASAKNLDMLRRVVAQAADRGLRVALMNYDNRDGGGKRDDRPPPSAARVAELLRGCPGLAMLGFRVKRTGSGAVETFEESYAKPSRAAGFHGGLYTRSWGTDRSTVAKLAQDWPGGFLVEVKYNGEQLGSPYPALHGWGEDYSFQDYLLHPRSFDVLWQVRANGTLRVLPWGDPSFVRRAAASFPLGGAAGFSVEPPWAYFSVDPKDRYREGQAALAEGERYLFERDWAFYAFWGRLTYDPATPDAVFARMFAARYGPAAGPAAFRTLTRMSRIVPAVYNAYAMGVDHRDAAPEMELGLLTKNRDHWRSLDELCAIQPLDRARGCSPAEFAAAAAEGRPEPRVSPVEATAELDCFAAETLAAARELGSTSREARAPGAAYALACEGGMAAYLGSSTAARLRALTAWAFYRRTRDARWLTRAQEELDRAAAHWKELATMADLLYLPVQDPLRAGADFTWASVLSHFERLRAELAGAVEAARREHEPLDGAPKLAGVFARGRAAFPELAVAFRRGEDRKLFVEVRFPAGAKAPRRLLFLSKPLDSETVWKTAEVEPKKEVYRLKLDEPADGLLIQFQATDEQGGGWLWPRGEDGLPYYWTGQQSREARP